MGTACISPPPPSAHDILGWRKTSSPTCVHLDEWGLKLIRADPWLWWRSQNPELSYLVRLAWMLESLKGTSQEDSNTTSENMSDSSSRETIARREGDGTPTEVATCPSHPALGEDNQNLRIAEQGVWQVSSPSDRPQQCHLFCHQALTDAGAENLLDRW